ncbi:monosaccharide ABC transporter ATP-binding protein, CUT2 family [Paramicrobacterium humi]|uniref:Monosaccharide ABC transporter ATP-binding protein, CUT2 family n=1 Tax=Paramicrobacterium humi TaxID=640635 RepID=A0A1H4KYC6_9MICO|nr:sugar ABC transporter ATP-binding protein [Microbacterium humi]SEB63216.1 monosaccharide ABC transporter ATP-binding protein, CUT2 family [Microbacterium humi]
MTMDALAHDIDGVAPATKPMIAASGLVKRYGSTQALSGVDLTIARGEILGLVGHNGAGKSTLTRMLAGIERPDSGSIAVAGNDVTGAFSAAAAEKAGIRMIYQELALCGDLSAVENAYLSDRRSTNPFTWRGQSEKRLRAALDEVFPGHGITVIKRAEELPMAKRQMVEIARALCTDNLSLLILDEPTESLDGEAAAQLYRQVRALADRGVSALLISHRMQEVIAHSDRILVMKDGRVADTVEAREATEDDLLVKMGGAVKADTATLRRVPETADAEASGSGDRVVALAGGVGASLEARRGEIIGLAGLAGQGQEEVLERLWNRGLFDSGVTVPRARAYVPGDRQVSGILPLWSVAENLTIAAGKAVSRFGVISGRRKRKLAAHWVDILRVRGGAGAPITSLSGGNQQKVLIARAFASDSDVVLLDDPFRGVDVATKNELYALMKAEAAQGRCIIWYSTENKEMAHCDRVYVFRAGRIVATLREDEISEESIIASSFDEISGHDK